jgi:DNA-directed RNA polymerase subunit alpha
MEQIILPTKVDYQPDPENKNKGQIIIEPCYPGYGITWGNALRRVLLSSLPGAAVTAVKIKGVRHEFSTIPHVKEDVLQIILNLKMLRLKIFDQSTSEEKKEPLKLKLSAKGEKKVTAADIEKSANVEIVNPDLYIATLTDKKAELEAEIIVDQGYGYVPSEEKDRTGLDLGTIVMDSIYSPIVKVGYRVDNVRVGKRTDYDRLSLTIETDGTITPWQAFIRAAELLNSQFKFLKETMEKKVKELEKEIVVEETSKKKATKKKKTTKKSKK